MGVLIYFLVRDPLEKIAICSYKVRDLKQG